MLYKVSGNSRRTSHVMRAGECGANTIQPISYLVWEGALESEGMPLLEWNQLDLEFRIHHDYG